MARKFHHITEIIDAAFASGQPITLVFQTGMGERLEDQLVAVRYERKGAFDAE